MLRAVTFYRKTFTLAQGKINLYLLNFFSAKTVPVTLLREQ